MTSGKDPFRTSRASSTSSTSALRHALEKVSHFNKAGTETKIHPNVYKATFGDTSVQNIGLQQWKTCCIVLSLSNCKHFCSVDALASINVWEPPPWEWPLMTWMCWTWCTPNRLHKSTWRLAEIMMRGKSDMYTCCTQWWPYAMPSLLSSLVCMPACPQACMSVCLYACVNVNVHIQVCKCKVAKKLIPQFRSLHVVLRQIEAPSRVHRYWY